jgi:hypothetical protein
MCSSNSPPVSECQFASFLGPVPAATLWAGYTGGVWRTAGSRPASADRVFTVINAVHLAAVLAHFLGWPLWRTVFGLPGWSTAKTSDRT